MLFIFFFSKQKTAYEMRISDWSSDVCSSDLKTVERTEWLLDHRRSRQPRGPATLCNQDSFVPQVPQGLAGGVTAHSVARRQRMLTRELGSGEFVVADSRSEERRVGKEGVSTCSSRWSPDP